MTAPRWLYLCIAACAVASTVALCVFALRTTDAPRYERVTGFDAALVGALAFDRARGELCIAAVRGTPRDTTPALQRRCAP